MKAKLLRGLLVILLGYLALVAARFIFLELGGEDDSGRGGRFLSRDSYMAVEMPAAEYAVRNYATLSYRAAGGATVDQKYEKVARVDSTSEHFEDDEKRARSAVEGFQGIIQVEAVRSSNGFRSLLLTIGVPPGEFDRAVEELRKIGRIGSYSISKNDKTNDFLQLRAKRTSLEKTRDAFAALKGQGGSIDELMKLEREMLDIESKLQDLGVQLGQFDQVNELCTVHFGLDEQAASVQRHPHFANFLAALAWASTVYLALLGATALGLVCLVLALLVSLKGKALLAASEK